MKKVIITGASGGIGKSLAEAYAAKGYSVGLTARRYEKLEEIQASLRAQYSRKDQMIEIAALDVDQFETVQPILHELADKLGGVDIVVVNAGVNKTTKVGGGQLLQEQQIIQTNITGAIATVNAAAEYFLKQGHGHVVGISSLAALVAIPRQAVYCASKAAVSMYLESARMELARKNIDVTTITPGFIKTDIVPGIEKYPFIVSPEKAAAEMLSLIERRKKTGIVPAWPWKFVKPFFGLIPDAVWSNMG